MNLNGLQLRTYLIGPIEAVSEGDAIKWRKDITPSLIDRGIYVFDPTHKTELGRLNEIGPEKAYINGLKNRGMWYQHHHKFKQIIHADLKYVDRSDFLIAYMPPHIPMWGTVHEALTAINQKKKVLTWTGRPKKESNSWMLTMVGADFIFETKEEIISYIDSQTPEELVYNFGE